TIGHGSGLGLDDGFGDGHGSVSGRMPPRHRPTSPTLRIAPVSVSGRLPPEVIQRIVRNNFGRFRVCYQTGLKTNPNLQGRVVVSFIIGRDGTVSGVGGSGDLPDGRVVGCVAGAFSGLTFPQPEGGIVTVRYPIVFTPGS
ncbi:MAG: FHA domain-containing protein, partial [Deltaproteobacteria bacterium]